MNWELFVTIISAAGVILFVWQAYGFIKKRMQVIDEYANEDVFDFDDGVDAIRDSLDDLRWYEHKYYWRRFKRWELIKHTWEEDGIAFARGDEDDLDDEEDY